MVCLEIRFMDTVTLDEAQRHLAELVFRLPAGGELLIVDANVPVAKLSSVTSLAPPTSLRQHQSSSIGAVLKPYPCASDDLLEEMRGKE